MRSKSLEGKHSVDTPVACYCRVSTDRQADDGKSLEWQRDTLTRAVALHFPRVRCEFFEEARSARDAKRPLYKEMMKGVRNGLFQAVLATDLDRLFRSVYDCCSFMREVDQYGVKVIVVCGGIDTSTEGGRIIVQIMSMLAEFESRNIGRRVTRAWEVHSAEGRKGPGYRPFGWNALDDGRLVVCDVEAAWVRRCLSERLKGRSWSALCQEALRIGPPTVSGRPWTPEGLRGCVMSFAAREEKMAAQGSKILLTGGSTESVGEGKPANKGSEGSGGKER